ncbi:THO complex subunit 1-like, partial [Lingula anatina]|uniref:THO complex subunit 1-like n=1 Tax=Lingula anatina TaxID=7574 RepID=A0A1S3H1P3_LINAN
MAASTASGSDFEKQRQTCLKFIEKHHNSTDLNGLRDEYQTLPGSESERKLALDQAFRDAVHKQVQSGGDISILTSLINLAVEAVRQELGSHSTPFLLLQDTFDGLELEKCSSLFKFVEDGVATWKSDIFYSAGKNYLLRMCNDLLRRLSKSLDTVFCGRIQLFLARLFPLEEKS